MHEIYAESLNYFKLSNPHINYLRKVLR